MRILFLLLLSFPAYAGIFNTTYDTNKITINIGTTVSGYAVLYMKGKHRLFNDSPLTEFCVLIDPVKLSTMQGMGNTSLNTLIWFTPSCADTGNAPPCLPVGAVVNLDMNSTWCQGVSE